MIGIFGGIASGVEWREVRIRGFAVGRQKLVVKGPPPCAQSSPYRACFTNRDEDAQRGDAEEAEIDGEGWEEEVAPKRGKDRNAMRFEC